ncbi:MAG: DUF2236 domain-containing protein [Myxococcales bacterium]|nr:DUF2236 domain-containing protein [Myxococcales bacterium]
MSTEGRWNDATLDAMRQLGDPVADEAVAALLARHDIAAVQRLMNTLVFNDQPVPDDLPEELRSYFEAIAHVTPPERTRIEAGERFFATHGPEILLILGTFSLPAAYAARKGVQVLYRTGYLNKRPNRRLFETTQMVVDVMSPGGLGPQGRGLRTAQKVRLMHAAVRHLIRNDAENPWDEAELGVPINQEDLAGTLMTFSEVVLEGLRLLGINFDPEGAAAYLDAWRVIGHLMGVRPELIPADLAEATTLTKRIHDRQIAPSPEGRLMTAALLEMMEINVPGRIFDGVPASLMRHFFEGYPGVADGLGIPKHVLEDKLVGFAAELGGRIASLIDAEAHRHRLLRALAIANIQFWINVDRGGVRTTFSVPTSLRTYWDLPDEAEPSLLDRLGRWVLGGRGREEKP